MHVSSVSENGAELADEVCRLFDSEASLVLVSMKYHDAAQIGKVDRAMKMTPHGPESSRPFLGFDPSHLLKQCIQKTMEVAF